MIPLDPSTRPSPRVSSPNFAGWTNPRFASRPTPPPLMPYTPNSFQVDDLLGVNMLPLDTAQSEGIFSKTSLEQPYSDRTTKVSGAAVETSTRASCPGLPTRTLKLLQGPSFPSLHVAVIKRAMVMLMGDDSQVLGRGDDNSTGRSSTGSYPSQDAYEELVAGNLHFAKL